MDAIVIEFKVYTPRKDKSLEDTVGTVLAQIEEKKFLISAILQNCICNI